MEQDIKILEDYIELIKKGYCKDCNELCNIYGTPAYPAEKISQAIENILKERQQDKEKIKELEEENKELKKDNKRYEKELHDVIEFSIPVSLVEETIEEYQNNMKLYENETHNIFNENNIRQEVITVLQELLERRK